MWLQMESLGNVDVFCTVGNLPTTFRDKYRNHRHFKISRKNFPAKIFRISIPADIGHKITLLTFFHIYYDLNPIISNNKSLKWRSDYYAWAFLLVCHFSQKPQFTSMTRSSFRGILTDRKVLPSKSMTSQLSNAHSTILLAILDQKLPHFEFQN